MFLSIGMLKQNYFLADIFILSAEKQPIKLSWRKIECLPLTLRPKSKVMMTREEVVEIMSYCKEHKVTYKVTILFSALTRMFPKPTFAP